MRPVILQRNENPIHPALIDIVNSSNKKTAYFVEGNSLETHFVPSSPIYGHHIATNNLSELRYSISKQLICLWWNPLNKRNSSQEEFSLFRGSWRWGHGKSCLLKYHTNAGCGVLVHCPSFKYFLPKLDWFFKLNSQWSRFQLYFLNIRLYFFKRGTVPHLLVF